MVVGLEKYRGTRRWLRLAFIMLPIISALDLILPFVLKALANSQLKKLKGFRGHLKSLHISTLKGNIIVTGLVIEEYFELTKTNAPLLFVDEVEVNFDWKALWKGLFILDILTEHPVFTLMIDHIKKGGAKRPKVPVIVTSLKVKNAKLTIIDYSVQPNIEVALTNLNVSASQLANIPFATVELPSTIALNGSIYDGQLNLTVKADLLKDDPNFDLNANMKRLNMPLLNDYFQHYGKFEVESGRLDVFVEAAAKDGSFTGYIKPLMCDLEIGGNEEQKGMLRKLWEGLLDTTTELLTNQDKDQLGTKLPIEGTFEKPKPNIIFAVGEVLYNAFVQALKPAIDNEIDINSVENK